MRGAMEGKIIGGLDLRPDPESRVTESRDPESRALPSAAMGVIAGAGEGGALCLQGKTDGHRSLIS